MLVCYSTATKGLWRRDEAEQTACIVRDIRDSSAWAWRQMQRTRLHGERLDCPILVCDGDKDWVTSVYPIRTGWAHYTTAEV
jgi:surfactin synthase thioesterase subunit